jgi:2TM domain
MTPEDESSLREQARKRLQKRRDFTAHLVTYVVVNSMLIGIWAITGAGYFWPAWVLLGWGVGLVLNAWDVFFRRPITEADIERELHRQR